MEGIRQEPKTTYQTNIGCHLFARNTWTRTANTSNTRNVNNINTSGTANNNNNASNAYAVLPDNALNIREK